MSRNRKGLTIILPVLSLIVSAGIVIHQYSRREGLRRDLARYDKEYSALEARFPKNTAPAVHHHGD